MRPTDAPSERRETVREAIRRVLSEGPASAKDLSGEVGISEKDVAGHLEHLQRSLKHEQAKLRVRPASCLACGYTFATRQRLTRPGACPECRSTRIDPPVFEIVSEAQGPKL